MTVGTFFQLNGCDRIFIPFWLHCGVSSVWYSSLGFAASAHSFISFSGCVFMQRQYTVKGIMRACMIRKRLVPSPACRDERQHLTPFVYVMDSQTLSSICLVVVISSIFISEISSHFGLRVTSGRCSQYRVVNMRLTVEAFAVIGHSVSFPVHDVILLEGTE